MNVLTWHLDLPVWIQVAVCGAVLGVAVLQEAKEVKKMEKKERHAGTSSVAAPSEMVTEPWHTYRVDGDDFTDGQVWAIEPGFDGLKVVVSPRRGQILVSIGTDSSADPETEISLDMTDAVFLSRGLLAAAQALGSSALNEYQGGA